MRARVAELADALDLGSSGQPWGFESPLSHHDDVGKNLGSEIFRKFINTAVPDSRDCPRSIARERRRR
jgi:hypothetical protein